MTFFARFTTIVLAGALFTPFAYAALNQAAQIF